MADEAAEVVLFTDGACSGNPGPGGWAYILRHPGSGQESRDSGNEPVSTNNRMELTAAVRGLSRLKRPTRVELVTDSVYVGTGISDWLPKWKQQGWKRTEGGMKTCGASSTGSSPSTPSASPTSPATLAMRRTRPATRWPWRPISRC